MRRAFAFVGALARTGAIVAIAATSTAAYAAADPSKVLRHVFPAAETGFDPAGVQDLYSATIEQMLFETLLTYDYLARPAKLVPLTAEALPEVTDNGKTYTVRVRKGIYFIDDPVFKGRKRELTAADYAYALKRLIDPKLRSPWAWLVEDKIVGLDAVAEAAKKTGKFDYDARPLHAAHPPQGHRLQPAVHPRPRADVSSRARSDRHLS